MNKMLKIIAIVVLVVVLLVAALLVWLAQRPYVPANYTENVPTGGALEAKYLAMGNHAVSYYESAAMSSFKKYEMFYPSDLSNQSEPLPVVVFVNGTGVKGSKYQELQKHLASWGFITIATEEEYAWNGFSAEMCVRYLNILNEYQGEVNGKDNVFYQRIDLDNIGITGHSQGGIGVINAITDQKHADVYKAAVDLSSGNKTMSTAIQWEYDETLIKAPILMIASTGSTDASLVPLEGLRELYDNIPDSTMKLMARRNDADHGEMLYYADGYVTAWFMYWLKEDTAAGDAFFGTGAEILTNPLYQDQQTNLQR